MYIKVFRISILQQQRCQSVLDLFCCYGLHITSRDYYNNIKYNNNQTHQFFVLDLAAPHQMIVAFALCCCCLLRCFSPTSLSGAFTMLCSKSRGKHKQSLHLPLLHESPPPINLELKAQKTMPPQYPSDARRRKVCSFFHFLSTFFSTFYFLHHPTTAAICPQPEQKEGPKPNFQNVWKLWKRCSEALEMMFRSFGSSER